MKEKLLFRVGISLPWCLEIWCLEIILACLDSDSSPFLDNFCSFFFFFKCVASSSLRILGRYSLGIFQGHGGHSCRAGNKNLSNNCRGDGRAP